MVMMNIRTTPFLFLLFLWVDTCCQCCCLDWQVEGGRGEGQRLIRPSVYTTNYRASQGSLQRLQTQTAARVRQEA